MQIAEQKQLRSLDATVAYVPFKNSAHIEDTDYTVGTIKSIKVGTSGIDIDTGNITVDIFLFIVTLSVFATLAYGKYFRKIK